MQGLPVKDRYILPKKQISDRGLTLVDFKQHTFTLIDSCLVQIERGPSRYKVKGHQGIEVWIIGDQTQAPDGHLYVKIVQRRQTGVTLVNIGAPDCLISIGIELEADKQRQNLRDVVVGCGERHDLALSPQIPLGISAKFEVQVRWLGFKNIVMIEPTNLLYSEDGGLPISMCTSAMKVKSEEDYYDRWDRILKERFEAEEDGRSLPSLPSENSFDTISAPRSEPPNQEDSDNDTAKPESFMNWHIHKGS